MKCKQNSLIPPGENFSSLGVPVKALRHFTRFDQVDQLAWTSE